MENIMKIFGGERHKGIIDKAFILALFSLMNINVNAQENTANKHYEIGEINNLKKQAKIIIDQLQPEKDSLVTVDAKLVWEIKKSQKVGNVVQITETRKDGSKINYIDGAELDTHTGHVSKTSNGFPLVSISSGSEGTILPVQSELEDIAENGQEFTNKDFEGQRVVVFPEDKSKEAVYFYDDEAKDFIGVIMKKFKKNLEVIGNTQGK